MSRLVLIVFADHLGLLRHPRWSAFPSSPRLLKLDKNFTECKQLPDFPIMSKSKLRQWFRKLGFCYKQRSKCTNNLVLVLCLQPPTLLKTRPRHRCLCEFCKVFKITYFAEYLCRAATNNMIIPKFFCKNLKDVDF